MSMKRRVRRAGGLAATLALAALPVCGAGGSPTTEEAKAFIERVEKEIAEVDVRAERAAWVQANFITEDTEAIAAGAAREALSVRMKAANEAARFAGLDLPPEIARKLLILRTSMPLAAPSDPGKQAELAEIAASMESLYGKGEYCRASGPCMDIGDLGRVMASSRDPNELLDLWIGWRRIAPPMRSRYRRFVELANEGARDLGFADMGALWRSAYDMPPERFAAELDRLWLQVKPLYDALHCHVRASLQQEYGRDLVPDGKPIPAHLLGNMWAQTWANVYDMVGVGDADPGYDLTALLVDRKVDERELVRIGERFFTSLGFDPLPPTFWDRSLFTKPADRDVVCHASAWDIDWEDDLRIKMCIEINEEDFSTVHHELGHNFYQRAYNSQPWLFREGANDGFHEGVGDTLALSITPAYLVKLGLLDKAPSGGGDLGILMKMALDKVAFLPFGLIVDQWRWKVFSGEVQPGAYNAAWWDLRRRYQGVDAPVPRTEEDFDPGAKYHVPANTPYTRYFLAGILQFQFHRALCRAAGAEGPLHQCSIHGSDEAGRRLREMLALGASRPWPDALEALTGQREMDATAMIDYFAPLKDWLDERNKERVCGW